jgi:hypothetical protein
VPPFARSRSEMRRPRNPVAPVMAVIKVAPFLRMA